jgi:hypothetical protein
MMAKAVDKRYQNCAELLKELNQLRETLALRTQQLGKTAVDLPAPSSSTVKTLRPPRSWTWWAGLVVTSIGLALIGGAAVAWVYSRTTAASPSGPPSVSAVPDGPIVTEQQKRLQFLLEAVAQYADPPPGDRYSRDLGVRHNLELALFYLKENRLKEADEFFTKLGDNSTKVPAYRTLGRLGHAIVLARQDRAAESIKLFQELMTDKPVPQQIQFFLNQPELRYEIARALEHNKANRGGLPPELERFREPPGPQQAGPPQGAGKRQ